MLWHERRAHVRVRMALTDRHSVFLVWRSDLPPVVKRRSRVLRRRTWQAALDKPRRVQDGQLGFVVLYHEFM